MLKSLDDHDSPFHPISRCPDLALFPGVFNHVDNPPKILVLCRPTRCVARSLVPGIVKAAKKAVANYLKVLIAKNGQDTIFGSSMLGPSILLYYFYTKKDDPDYKVPTHTGWVAARV
ncbi:hypothetical protein PoB_007485100 [Plakobranchus ocellatus]|uniref:Uncharacterized protein n=1 Tax=Plakobranchus ocellatus TaxID=259542 RepID=A0AAV4DWY2_9GAST|nr:hypothetical protein PoB_007485100 [Plakobranchus ocellatus]